MKSPIKVAEEKKNVKKENLKSPIFQAEAPPVVLAPPTNPAMDYLVQSNAQIRHKVENLQLCSKIIFKQVNGVPSLKPVLNNIFTDLETVRNDTLTNTLAIERLDKKIEAQDEVLSKIHLMLENLSNKGPSFTADDRRNLGSVADTQKAQGEVLTNIGTNVRTILIHSLPVANKKGEKIDLELQDELLAQVNRIIPEKAEASNANEADEEEEEDEEDDDETEDDEPSDFFRKNNNDDDDDDDDDMPSDYHQIFVAFRPEGVSLNEPLGDRQNPSKDKSGPSTQK